LNWKLREGQDWRCAGETGDNGEKRLSAGEKGITFIIRVKDKKQGNQLRKKYNLDETSQEKSHVLLNLSY
jgi:hypothetical protein